jgi:hypothetical protein
MKGRAADDQELKRNELITMYYAIEEILAKILNGNRGESGLTTRIA